MSKILAIVDDEPAVFESLRDSFTFSLPGLKVVGYSGGEELLTALRNGLVHDAVLMDRLLSDGYTGLQYTAAVVALCPKTVVIGFSSSIKAEDRRQFFENGAKYFLPKNAPLKEIERVIREAVGL